MPKTLHVNLDTDVFVDLEDGERFKMVYDPSSDNFILKSIDSEALYFTEGTTRKTLAEAVTELIKSGQLRPVKTFEEGRSTFYHIETAPSGEHGFKQVATKFIGEVDVTY